MRIHAVADCETLPFKHGRPIIDAYVWEFFDGTEKFVTYSTVQFVEYIREYEGIIYAHNGGKFDWHFLLPYLEPYEPILIINGRIAKVRLGKCELRDSYNIIPVPLKAYKKDDFDYTLLEVENRSIGNNGAIIERYLHNDCKFLLELVNRFYDDFGASLTQAGAAMKQWVKISGEPAPRTDKYFYTYFSPYYYGGRVECFESGVIHGDFKKFDINSAYPRAMLEVHPYTDIFTVYDGYHRGSDFYDVRCDSAGAFPYRDGYLTFPCDGVIRDYRVTQWEYDAAISTGTISCVTVLRSIKFSAHTDFSQYVNHFYELRRACKEAGDDAGALFGKLFMNSLYGKFAANPSNYVECMIVPMDVLPGLHESGYTFGGELGPWGLAEMPLEEEKQRFYNVATGASITGYVRAMLWRAICGAKRVLYCDTDAITCEQPGPEVVIGDALGEWKHEGDYSRVGIGGKKLYIMESDELDDSGDKVVSTASKGCRLTDDELWAVASGKDVTYRSEAPTFSAKKAQSFVVRQIRNTVKINTHDR